LKNQAPPFESRWMTFYQTIRPLIYLLKPEAAHHVTLFALQVAGSMLPGRWVMRRLFISRHNGPAVEAFGLRFPNPLGMAAGYDKDGLGWRGLAELGFGHIEVGTVTPRPQPGNPRPRVFRLVEDKAAINRMGFPNRGEIFLARRLRGKRPPGLVLGVNIGKNKATPLEEAVQDYLSLMRTFAPLCDYLAVNVSSPNTPGLRTLQSRQALHDLLAPLAEERSGLAKRLGKPVPLLVKLAPDLSEAELEDSLAVITETGMDGVIAGNTTLSREGLNSPLAVETGGMSGEPLRARSTAMVRQIARMTHGRLPIVASGGVMTPTDAREKIDAGAVLVQLYTGLVYAGPSLVKTILDAGVLNNLVKD
jgi:dihydroorotate dehydrogenase